MSDPVECRNLKTPLAGEAKVIAIFSFRYEAHLVPALLENISPLVHGYAAWDDRGATGTLTNEPERRNRLNAAAIAMGADWILAVDPDERFEDSLASRIGDLTRDKAARKLWAFRVRELFAPDKWRSEGVWGGKEQTRLYPAHAVQASLTQPLHGQWVAGAKGYRVHQTGLNLYHLRHISPERGQRRRDTYAAADPERQYNPVGYDYLADPRGATFQSIHPWRGYHPPHIDDGALWAPPAKALNGPLLPDPPVSRLNFMARSVQLRGSDPAARAAEDLLQADPEDSDLRIVAASLALNADRAADAIRLTAPLTGASLPPLLSLAIAGQARMLTGEGGEREVAALRAAAPRSLWMEHLATSALRDDPPFDHPNALWRRWCPGEAWVAEGPDNGNGPLTVIVMGFRAQKGLAAAVTSIRDQSADTEIVVVNSGGGDVRRLLAAHLPHIRLIAVEAPLMAGAARNIGIDASRGPVVAFLAGDCEALPGWTDARLASHRAGAMSVSTPVVPRRPGTITGALVASLRFQSRDPQVQEDKASHFGRSYDRQIFLRAGYFPTGLRQGEDAEFNKRLDQVYAPVWASGILTRHGDPATPFGLVWDAWHRAKRMAAHLPTIPGAPGAKKNASIERRVEFFRERARTFRPADHGLGPFRAMIARGFKELFLIATEAGLRKAVKQFSSAAAAAGMAQRLIGKNPRRAAEMARKATQLSPQDWRYHLLLGKALSACDDPAGLAAFAQAQSLVPVNAEPLALAAAFLQRTGQPQAAVDLAERVVIIAPRATDLLAEAARVAERADDGALALAFAQAALASAPASAELHELLARLHEAAGDARLAGTRRRMAEAIGDRRKSETGRMAAE